MPLQEVWLKAKPSYPAKPAAVDTWLSSLHITSYSLPQCPKLDSKVHSETRKQRYHEVLPYPPLLKAHTQFP